MGSYLPTAQEERQQLLEALGLTSFDQLFEDVPESIRLTAPPEGLPKGKSEFEVRKQVEGLAAQNTIFPTLLRGAGAYRHYIPSAVGHIMSKEAFLTAYTPYQAEISQGILQSIFEFQTMMCQLTGMDSSNASLYDGPTAAAEGMAMCIDRKRTRVLVSATTHPETIAVMKTYAFGSGATLEIVPAKDGVTDGEALSSMMADDVTAIYVQHPNFYGMLEPCETLFDIAHQGGAKAIVGVNPATLGVLKTPRDYGADIAVGEGQPLGIPLSWGGPYLGFMTCTSALTRKLPGRIVGETVDSRGNRAYVLTLQAREQHIRREKASSNVCSNQARCALTASVYLSLMGPNGLKEVGQQCHAKAHYLAEELTKISGVTLRHTNPWFPLV